MPFDKEQTRNQQPTSIGVIAITLYDANGRIEDMSARVEFEIFDQAGNVMQTRHVDLAERLPDAKVIEFRAFMTGLRTRIMSEVIP